MKYPVAVFAILCLLPVVSCVTAKKFPSPDAVSKNCVLAYGISFSHRSILGSVLDSDTESELRYVRASRISGGKIVPGTTITTDIISDTMVFFAGVAPGDYAITDLVFSKRLGAKEGSDHGRITIADSVIKFTVAVLPDDDMRKTAAAAEAGAVCYAGRFTVHADGSLRNLLPYFDADKSGVKKISVDKGYASSVNTADDVVAGSAVPVPRSADDDAYFKTKAAVLLAGSGWEKLPVKTGK